MKTKDQNLKGIWYGIDFGTTNSSISYITPDGQVDTIDVSAGPESKIIPSAVFWKENSIPLIGQDALDAKARKMPGKILVSYKPCLSTPVRGATRWVAEVKPGVLKDDWHGQCIVHVGRETRYKLVTEKNENLNDYKYHIDDVINSSAGVISYLIKKANTALGITFPEGVVVGVPVEFSDAAKERLIEAVFMSGLVKEKEKIVVIPEPLAIALQYGAEKKGSGRILIFDFGGGTLDLCVVELKGEIGKGDFRYSVLAKDVYNQAGTHFDRKFLNIIIKRYINDFNERAQIKDINNFNDVTFWGVIENLKKKLSDLDSWLLSYDNYGLDENPVTITRDDFDEAIKYDLHDIELKVRDIVKQAAKTVGSSENDLIDEVYLAGGSSLIPAVKKLMNNIFPGRIRYDYAGPGKATNGFALSARYSEFIDDIVDFTYGIWDYGEERIVSVIERGVPISSVTLQTQIDDGKGLEIETNCSGCATVAIFVQRNERWEIAREYQVEFSKEVSKLKLYCVINPYNNQFSLVSNESDFFVKQLEPGTIPCLEPGQIIKYNTGRAEEKIGCIQGIVNIRKGIEVNLVVGELNKRYKFILHEPFQRSINNEVLNNNQITVMNIKYPLPGEGIDLTNMKYISNLFSPFSIYKTIPFYIYNYEINQLADCENNIEGNERKKTKHEHIDVINPVNHIKTESEDKPFLSDIYDALQLVSEEVHKELDLVNKLVNLSIGEIKKDNYLETLDTVFSLHARLQKRLDSLISLLEFNMENVQKPLLGSINSINIKLSELHGYIQDEEAKNLISRILDLPEESHRKTYQYRTKDVAAIKE